MARKRILLVDDEPDMRSLIRICLDRAGAYEVIEAASGEDALEKARVCAPDLILMDVRMPGITGVEACRQLKATPALCDIPVIFVSAWHSGAERIEAEAAGGVAFVPKPFSRERLWQLVAQYA